MDLNKYVPLFIDIEPYVLTMINHIQDDPDYKEKYKEDHEDGCFYSIVFIQSYKEQKNVKRLYEFLQKKCKKVNHHLIKDLIYDLLKLEHKCSEGLWSWAELDMFDKEINMDKISYKKVGKFKFF